MVVLRHRTDHEGHAGLEQGRLDFLPLPGFQAPDVGRQDAVARPHRRDDVAEGIAERNRRAVLDDGGGCEAACRQGDHVHARELRLRTRLPEARERCVDQGRVDLLEPRIRQTKLVHDARPEILDENVGGAHEIEKDRLSLRLLQIERDALLVAVEHHEDDALVRHVGIAAAGLRLLAGTFDLDDLRPHVAEHHAAERACPCVRQLDDANALQRTRRHSVCSFSRSIQLRDADGCPAHAFPAAVFWPFWFSHQISSWTRGWPDCSTTSLTMAFGVISSPA